MEDIEAIYQIEEVNFISLVKKFFSQKLLILSFLIFGLIGGFIWAYLIYQPSYDLSVSYSCEISENSTLSDLYGVDYSFLEYMIDRFTNIENVRRYISENNPAENQIVPDSFVKKINSEKRNGLITLIINDVNAEKANTYKEYINYTINQLNQEIKSLIIPQLEFARTSIINELKSLQNTVFQSELVDSSHYLYMITLADRQKNVDIQIKTIDNGVVQCVSDFNLQKISSRAKGMIMIVLISCVIGFICVLCISLSDKHIYFSSDITDIPILSKRLLACIPLTAEIAYSQKDYVNIMSKLPNDLKKISISEVAENSGAMMFAEWMQKSPSIVDSAVLGRFSNDADIISAFDKYDVNIVFLRAGIDQLIQVKNIVRDCYIKGIDNYFFVLNGVDPTDKMVTLFVNKSNYIKYSYLSFYSLRQHFLKNWRK